jgi:AcrR family transcriptional regulator
VPYIVITVNDRVTGDASGVAGDGLGTWIETTKRGPISSIDVSARSRPAGEPVDGRHRRSATSQRRIVQAMLELVGEGNVSPSADEVSERAGVGRRSVFRHFNDMESLYREMAAVLQARFASIAGRPYKATHWRDQLLEMVDRRADAFERMSPYLRAGRVHRHHSHILREGHARFVAALRMILVQRLPSDLAQDHVFVDAIDLLTSFEAWLRLRDEQRLSPEKTKQVVRATVVALLDQRERDQATS